jgi:hypothetical protein
MQLAVFFVVAAVTGTRRIFRLPPHLRVLADRLCHTQSHSRTVAKSPGNFETGIRDRIEGAVVADEMLDTSDITGMGDQHRAGLLQANALLQLRGGSYPNCFNGDIRRRRRPAVLTTCPLGSVAVDSLDELRPRFATEVAEPGCEGDHRDRDR